MILTVFIILGLLYDFTVPIFEKPDELKHFALIQVIQTQHQLPVVREGVYKPWDQEGTQPPLYHILAAVATSWLDLDSFEEPPRNPHYADDRSFVWRERGNNNLYLHPPGETWSTTPVIIAAHIARWLSLLAGAATVALTYILARIIFVDDSSPSFAVSRWQSAALDHSSFLIIPNSSFIILFLSAAFVAFVPQFLHVSSAITNDSLTVTLAVAALVVLALVIKRGGSMRYAVFLGIILGLGAITKLSMLYLWPVTGLVFLYDVYRRQAWLDLFKFGAVIIGLILLLAGWWYWRNMQLYGDPTALEAHLLYRGGALDPRPTLAEIWRTEIVGLELSFWAAFGAGQVLLEPWLYNVLRWVKYFVLIGIIIGLVRMISSARSAGNDQSPISNLQSPIFVLLCLLALWVLIIFVALLRWMQITPASWGRLLFPTLPALGILTAWGLAELGYFLARLRPNAPSETKLNVVLPSILVAVLFSLSVIAPFRYIQAAYAQTPLVDEAQLDLNSLTQVDWVYADALRLIGYTIDRPAVRPGEWLPVTLYWQAMRPLDRNYSAFVHVLDPDGKSIGQANTYPDGGNWPTSMLVPGQVLRDTYQVFIPPDAEAPLITRFTFGIFDFDDPARAALPAINSAGDTLEAIVDGIPLLPPQWPELDPRHPLVVDFGGRIQLIGYDWVHETVLKPGTRVPITFYWETLLPPGQNLNLFIHLVDPATQTQVAGFDGPPRYPTAYWQPGNNIIDTRLLDIPADVQPGIYELRIGWYNLDNFARLTLLDGEGDSLTMFEVQVSRD
ncbi:MAG: glycosyltransferase family 39 protein [Anaerolineae bacterium]|nr:glycosyltransferase family 39 protein [Anaerolineae bacterium]